MEDSANSCKWYGASFFLYKLQRLNIKFELPGNLDWMNFDRARIPWIEKSWPNEEVLDGWGFIDWGFPLWMNLDRPRKSCMDEFLLTYDFHYGWVLTDLGSPGWIRLNWPTEDFHYRWILTDREPTENFLDGWILTDQEFSRRMNLGRLRISIMDEYWPT
jgi:hypothetical protein